MTYTTHGNIERIIFGVIRIKYIIKGLEWEKEKKKMANAFQLDNELKVKDVRIMKCFKCHDWNHTSNTCQFFIPWINVCKVYGNYDYKTKDYPIFNEIVKNFNLMRDEPNPNLDWIRMWI